MAEYDKEILETVAMLPLPPLAVFDRTRIFEK